MNKLLPLLLFAFLGNRVHAQDSVQYRVIFIGDAGEMNAEQQKSLQHAANHIITGKTTVLYLGDNVYPHGMGLPGSKEETTSQQILQSQYLPMRAKGAPVYFVPGNHDWDKMGPKGLAKIKRQWQYLDERGDSLLQLIPANGCPDPVEIPLTDSLTIIAYDSEWWLFPFSKNNPDGECACKTKKDVLIRLAELQYKNRNKIVLLASHHPFQSYGVHGGVFTFKDHLFPLTAVNHNLYIPLPVIGSLYPFLRSTFTNPEDLKHPLYKDMKKRIDAVFATNPNMIHVAGHEHGLQFIKDKKQVQVVSGAGAKHTNAKKGKYSQFAEATQGYVTADLLLNGHMRFTYYVYESDTIRNAFTYEQAYTPVIEKSDTSLIAQYKDSVTVAVHPSYDKPGGFHRWIFGENYRKEWAMPVTLPVIRLSEIHGGLTPLQLGGGMQSKSLRLQDKEGKEWVIRSVEKTPDALLPAGLQDAFARDWLDDVTSAQHPFSALSVPPIANAVKVPHAHPIIGVMAPDKKLGLYENIFANMVVLLEEREPGGESDNSEKMKKALWKDNENDIKAKEMLRARMLDAFLGDWDRHEDQWRWRNEGKGKDKLYVAVPRDRDQVFHVTQGVLPWLASQDYVLPTLRNFDNKMGHIQWLLFKTRFVNAYPSFQFTRAQWQEEAKKFQESLTDSVLEAALRQLPAPAYQLRHQQLMSTMQERRSSLPAAMDKYYCFTQKIADIQTSNKNELVQITDGANGGLQVRISRLNKNKEVKEELMNKTYEAGLTKEVRLFIGNGEDSVIIDNKTTDIKLRIIGGHDAKSYNVVAANRKVLLYDRANQSSFNGDFSRFRKRISDDSLNTAFTPVNLYNSWMPLALVGLNRDDGFILGAGFRHIKQEGFRRYPYSVMQQVLAGHSFSTDAFYVKYRGEWIGSPGRPDFILSATAKAPNNTINFYGRGNESEFNKTGDFVRFYRTRFSIYDVNPELRWRSQGNKSSVSIGPALEYYEFDQDDNAGRYITSGGKIGSYDSSSITQSKLHAGATVTYIFDNRNNKVIPQWGSYVNIKVKAYQGVSSYAKSFAQIIPEVALYKNLNAKASIVLAERLGGTITVGKSAFYQSAFLGGHENLLGYRQYRFSGQHSLYNNLEMRIKLADVANYILPGQLGITGFWDIGRVWEQSEDSGKWHNGVGGGIYFAPVSMVAFSFVVGNSSEGWYPYFTMGFRF
ncbi:Calcineurin-like phosphoesterase [Filimonas lacunae]|uniref:Calcineurin-like phosphoesterase n=1 Tax=Filimonas lacunae TaxID=477680 RepID=A0A173MK69_9BACT|nr:BamA/TamA family outer membrane protein [Filimonas lacunae]BAV07798.1 surface antigen precursor [Filimonas lacunae]SIT04913.1 Calcineurin-like phosphoesterase [Filimonas lacunae]